MEEASLKPIDSELGGALIPSLFTLRKPWSQNGIR